MRIVMTGATSGLGLVAAQQLVAMPGVELIVGARGALPPTIAGQAQAIRLDLADLDSVSAFADALGAARIDAFIGNAGTQIVRPATSRQGYELTFATNHLAHYLLVRRIYPLIAPNGRIVLTSSGTHDPEQKTGMPPPNHANADWLAHPDHDPHHDASAGRAGRRAYSTSKLCNLMTIRELAVRAVDRPDMTMLAYDPGFCPGTGLARDYGGVGSWIFRHILPLVVRGPGISDPVTSGKVLAALAVDPAYAGGRGLYWSMHNRVPMVREPSVIARDAVACAALWDASAAMVGLQP